MLRSLRRNVVKNRMKKMGYVHICKRSKGTSWFSKHWRTFGKAGR